MLYEQNTESVFYKLLDEDTVTVGNTEGFMYMMNRPPVATASGCLGLTMQLDYQ